VVATFGARVALGTFSSRLALGLVGAALTLAITAAGLGLAAPDARAADAVPASKKKPTAKKKSCRKTHTRIKGKCVRRCKKTHTRRKGKCVRRKSPTSPPTKPGPNPLSDADGDGIPYKWETTAPAKPPTKPVRPRCTSKQRLSKGRCVPRCKKGRTLKRGKRGKRGKCVKKKKSKRKRAKAKASSTAASVAPLGANPNHKDIFVQIDFASAALRQSALCSELDKLVAAFANAPVSNPDGKPGIDLHVDAGKTCPSRSYDLGGSRVFNAGACPGTSATFHAVNLPESRVGTFHVAGLVPTCGGGGGEGGAATFLGTEMVVYTDGLGFAHVLMHELGHNLGLDHQFPGQPNRLSSMNTRLHVSSSGSGATEVLDFQRFSLPALDENALSEPAGISAPAAAHRFYIPHYCPGGGIENAWPGDGSIDWNCNSPILLPGQLPTIDPEPQSIDVNGDGQKTILPATHNEWVTLQYASGGGIGPR
jgi:hypothetical protein